MEIHHKDGNASGTVLPEALDFIVPPTYPIDKSFCLSLQVVYKIGVKLCLGTIWASMSGQLSVKGVCCDNVAGDNKSDLPMEAAGFTALVIILNHPGQNRAGYGPELHCYTAHIACKFAKLKKKVVVLLLCLSPLSHFAAHDIRETVAMGIIRAVDKKSSGAGKVTKSAQKTPKLIFSRTLHTVLIGCGGIAQNCLSHLAI
ncbi:hypothetical protein HPG69_013747 [Diceros bicornis minor]|uniref:GTP-eEF1A C-terminal domain-containing protein n=1 Tax=Diceros bicornis minor TaxID=77932 RepID=A0A7J7FEC6_DICBM|nr:hypothetical protein HPG69_013747 [Diceros bicornis minor]